MKDRNENPNSGEDSNSWGKNFGIALGLAVLYLVSRGWLPERAFLWIMVTVVLFYNAIAPFRDYWAKLAFWRAVVIVFAGHAVLIGYLDGHEHVLQFRFWPLIALMFLEGMAMITILGWILRDGYWTRNTRRARARETAGQGQAEGAQQGQDEGVHRRSRTHRPAGQDPHASSKRNE